MHDIWNPWHGCRKISEGCAHCYMYYLDKVRNQDGSRIYRTMNFEYPLFRNSNGEFLIKPGEMIRVSMTSDFFLEDADKWRRDAWRMIKERSDVVFFLLTKRAERIPACLPDDWGTGYPNVFLNVTAENQRRADERIPIILSIPAAHRGVMTAPLLGPIKLGKYLGKGKIEQVVAGGENYDGARPVKYEWVESLSGECKENNVRFAFIETGNTFIKDGKVHHYKSKKEQSREAFRLGLENEGLPLHFPLKVKEPDLFGSSWHIPYFDPVECAECGSRIICNGCARCGKCKK